MKAGKRKRPVFADSSSEDAPLASSSPAKSRLVAVSMPNAIDATTLPSSTNGKGKGTDNINADSYKDIKSKKTLVNGNGKGPAKKKVKKERDHRSDSEDDQPIKKRKKTATKKKKVQVESDGEADSEENVPMKKRARKASAKNGKLKKEENEVDMDTPKKNGKLKKEENEVDMDTPKKSVTKDVDATPKKGKGKTKEEEEEEVYKWWEAQNAEGDGSEKWRTLEHNGVIFPPPYEPLPKDVKMKYNGGLWLICRTDTCLTLIFHRARYRSSTSL